MAKEDVDIKLGLDAKSFQRTLTSVKASFKSWKSEVASDIKSAFAFGAVIASVKALSDQVLQLKRNAEDFGTSIEFLQGVQRLAVKFGGSAEDANNALTKLAETIGQARTEGGEAEDKFKRFGISLYDTAGQAKTTEEVFKDIANAYRNSSDAATKAALAFEFFGRTGRNINNILGEGADGIDSYTKAMMKLGLVASASNVNEIADAWNNVKTSVSGIGATLFGSLLKAYTFIPKLAGALSAVVFGSAGLKEALRGARADGAIVSRGTRAEDEATRQQEAAKAAIKNAADLLAIEKERAQVFYEMQDDFDKVVILEGELVELGKKLNDFGLSELDYAKAKLEFDKKSVEQEKIKARINKEAEEAEKRAAKARAEEEETIQRLINARAADIMTRRADVMKQRADAETQRADRTKFTLGELAGANVRGVSDPALRADIMKAREVQRLQSQAERLRLSGRSGSIGEAQGLLSRADELRQSIGSLRSDERMTSMDQKLADVRTSIQEINALSKGTGLKMIPVLG